jgi:hypothetical protein
MKTMKFSVPIILIFGVTFLTSLNAEAYSPIAREAVAVVQTPT